VPTVEHKLNFDNLVESVKSHVKRHQVIYSLGAGVGIAGITSLIMRGQCAGIQRVPDRTLTSVFARPLFIFSNHNKMNTTVAIFLRDGRGHPGYPIRCMETGDIFPSQDKAALAFGVYPSLLSGHLNGKFPDVHGWHFERLSAIPAVAA